MAIVQTGVRVLTPRTSGSNGSEDKAVAFVTRVTGTNGGNSIVNLQVIPNFAVGTLTPAPFLTGVEVFDYESDARDAGVGNGAWIADWP